MQLRRITTKIPTVKKTQQELKRVTKLLGLIKQHGDISPDLQKKIHQNRWDWSNPVHWNLQRSDEYEKYLNHRVFKLRSIMAEYIMTHPNQVFRPNLKKEMILHHHDICSQLHEDARLLKRQLKYTKKEDKREAIQNTIMEYENFMNYPWDYSLKTMEFVEPTHLWNKDP